MGFTTARLVKPMQIGRSYCISILYIHSLLDFLATIILFSHTRVETYNSRSCQRCLIITYYVVVYIYIHVVLHTCSENQCLQKCAEKVMKITAKKCSVPTHIWNGKRWNFHPEYLPP